MEFSMAPGRAIRTRMRRHRGSPSTWQKTLRYAREGAMSRGDPPRARRSHDGKILGLKGRRNSLRHRCATRLAIRWLRASDSWRGLEAQERNWRRFHEV